MPSSLLLQNWVASHANGATWAPLQFGVKWFSIVWQCRGSYSCGTKRASQYYRRYASKRSEKKGRAMTDCKWCSNHVSYDDAVKVFKGGGEQDWYCSERCKSESLQQRNIAHTSGSGTVSWDDLQHVCEGLGKRFAGIENRQSAFESATNDELYARWYMIMLILRNLVERELISANDLADDLRRSIVRTDIGTQRPNVAKLLDGYIAHIEGFTK